MSSDGSIQFGGRLFSGIEAVHTQFKTDGGGQKFLEAAINDRLSETDGKPKSVVFRIPGKQQPIFVEARSYKAADVASAFINVKTKLLANLGKQNETISSILRGVDKFFGAVTLRFFRSSGKLGEADIALIINALVKADNKKALPQQLQPYLKNPPFTNRGLRKMLEICRGCNFDLSQHVKEFEQSKLKGTAYFQIAHNIDKLNEYCDKFAEILYHLKFNLLQVDDFSESRGRAEDKKIKAARKALKLLTKIGEDFPPEGQKTKKNKSKVQQAAIEMFKNEGFSTRKLRTMAKLRTGLACAFLGRGGNDSILYPGSR